MQASISERDTQSGKRLPRRRNAFFLIAAVLVTLTVFVGFGPSFFLRPHFRTTALPLYLVVHGLLMTAWQLLFVAQTLLVATRRTVVHRRLGIVGAVLAVAVIASGVAVTLRLPASWARLSGPPPFPIEPMVIGNLFGFATFAGFVIAAILLRRQVDWHKRLMYWGSLVTVGPALTPGRDLGALILPYFPTTFPPEIALAWIAWIALLVHDWRSARLFHPATILGGIVLLLVMPAVVDWVLKIEFLGAWVRSLA